MDERAWLIEHFEEHRTRLRAVAYRMLGSLSEADDAVQEAWLRLSRADTSSIENLLTSPSSRPRPRVGTLSEILTHSAFAL
jgi:DNA-directed RNA polymerase specialized sigma24 family protein